MIKYLMFLILITPVFSQDLKNVDDSSVENINEVSKNHFFSFRHVKDDRYYIGWQDPRAFVSRFSIYDNVDLQDALLSRNPNSAQGWNFDGITAYLEGRAATELYLLRTPYVALGFGMAVDIPMLAREITQTVNVYGLVGQAALFFDIFLPYNLKLRITPLFHESVHLVDGYRGEKSDFGIISYEFFAVELYHRYQWFTFYTGIEYTYSSVGERDLSLRMHYGTDFRYPIWNDIYAITGINVAALHDKNNTRHPETSGWHPAVNYAVGMELGRLVVAFKVSHQRGFDASTYHYMQTKYGLETTILF